MCPIVKTECFPVPVGANTEGQDLLHGLSQASAGNGCGQMEGLGVRL